jgi:hypothetical protein
LPHGHAVIERRFSTRGEYERDFDHFLHYVSLLSYHP